MTHHTDRAALAGRLAVDPQAARRINAIMMTRGHCDASGDLAAGVGLPGENGVGGGILERQGLL